MQSPTAGDDGWAFSYERGTPVLDDGSALDSGGDGEDADENEWVA